jgi:hypothetical protein
MPSRPRPWREAIAVLAAAGWDPRDIATVLRVAPGTVHRVLGIRVWEQATPPAATCSRRVGDGWCDRPVAAGHTLCDEHWRLGWPQ